jgi:hypothetical protein
MYQVSTVTLESSMLAEIRGTPRMTEHDMRPARPRRLHHCVRRRISDRLISGHDQHPSRTYDKPPLARCFGCRRKPFLVWLLRPFGAISGETQGGRNSKWSCFAPTGNTHLFPLLCQPQLDRSWLQRRQRHIERREWCPSWKSLTRLSRAPHNDKTEKDCMRRGATTTKTTFAERDASSLREFRTCPSRGKDM